MALLDFFRRFVSRDEDEEEKRKRAAAASGSQPIIFKQDSFTKKEDQPTENFATRVRDFVGRGVENVKKAYTQDPDRYNVFAQFAKGDTTPTSGIDLTTGISGLDFLPKAGSEYLQNRVIKPVQQIPQNIETIRDPNKSFIEKGAAGLMTAAALVPGVDDAVYAMLYDVPKATIAGKSTLKAFTGSEYTGLGDALVGAKNQDVSTALNLAELPLLVAGSMAAKNQVAKRLASQADSPAVAAAVKQGMLTADDPTVLKRFKEYADLKPDFDKALLDISKRTGMTVDIPELKKMARTIEKANVDYGGDITKVKDIARAQFVPDSPTQAKVLLQELQDNFNVTSVKDRFANPGPDGYRDFMLNVDLGDGKLGEIQIQLPEMLAAKKSPDGHTLYKEFRKLDAISKERDLNADEVNVMLGLQQKMKTVYDAAWEKANQRLGSTDAPESFNIALKSLSDTSDPLRMMDETGNLRGGFVSKASTDIPPSGVGVMDTGVPSTSKNLASTKPIVAESNTAEAILTNQIGNTFQKVEPVGNLWKSKGDVIFIKPDRDNPAYVRWLRDKNFIESAEEAGNGIYRVKVKKSPKTIVNEKQLPLVDRTQLTGQQLLTPSENIKPTVSIESIDGSGGTPPSNSGQKPRVFIDEAGKLRGTENPKFEAAVKYYDTPDEVKQTIVDLVDKNYAGVQTARRGAITFKETRAMADALGMSVEEVEKRQPGKIWNAEQADAATRMMIDVNTKLTDVSQEIRKIKDTGGEVPEKLQLQQIDLAAQAQAMTAAILGDNAEAGRALNARKMLKAAMETNDIKAKKEALKMFAGDEAKAKEVIAKLSEFDPDDSLGRAKFLRNIKPSTPIEMIEEYWYNSVLSNTATHIVNSVSNGMASLMSLPERIVAGTLDEAGEQGAKLLGKAYKRDRYVAEAAAEAAGISDGVKKGIQRAMYVMRNGMSETQANKLDIGKGQAIKGPIGNVVNIPSRALVAEDEIFKGINYEMAMHSLATREAAKSGLKGSELTKRAAEILADPTPQMISEATDISKYRAFQSDSMVADAIRTARDKVKIPLGKLGEFKPLRFIIPFIQTPVNVVKYGLERSPAGFIGTAYKAAQGASKGEVLDSASRALIGSTMMIPLAMYFTEDKITGAPPKDKKERDAFYADGKLPFSVKIGDNWVAYNRVEPLNTILTQIAMWHDASKAGKDTTVEKISEFLRASGRNIADQTFLTGIGNLVEAIEDPERFGQKFITDITGGFVPSIVAAGARSVDENVRQPDTFVDSLKTRLPFLSKDVPAMESTFEPDGKVVRHTNGDPLRTFMSNFVGLRTSKETGTNYQENVKAVRAADKITRESRDKVKATASDLLEAIRSTAPEKRGEIIKQAVDSGNLTPEVLEQVKAELKKTIVSGSKSQAIEMEMIKGYSNETRARYIVNKIKELPDDQKQAWLATLMANKVVTQDTIKEIKKQLSQPSE